MALITEVMIAITCWVLGLKRLNTKSILTCPSLFNTQAAMRKVIYTIEYSLISTTHAIGRSNKYLDATPMLMLSTEKMRRIPAKIPITSMVRLTIFLNIPTIFMVTQFSASNVFQQPERGHGL